MDNQCHLCVAVQNCCGGRTWFRDIITGNYRKYSVFLTFCIKKFFVPAIWVRIQGEIYNSSFASKNGFIMHRRIWSEKTGEINLCVTKNEINFYEKVLYAAKKHIPLEMGANDIFYGRPAFYNDRGGVLDNV